MARYGKDSKHGPDRVLQEAEKFFGPSGLGLALRVRRSDLRSFTGGGGSVVVRATAKGRGSEVEVEAREWDQQIPGFLQRI